MKNAAPSSGAALEIAGRSSEANRPQITPPSTKIQGFDWPLVAACQSLHALGARATYELIVELIDDYYIDSHEVTARLRRFNNLPPGVTVALVGEEFPPPPLTVVRSYERS